MRCLSNQLAKTKAMKTKITSIRRISSLFLLVSLILSLNACSVSKDGHKRSNDSGFIKAEQINRGSAARKSGERAQAYPGVTNVVYNNGPPQPSQNTNSQNRPSRGERDHGNRLGDIIGWILGGLLNMFSNR